MNPAPLEQVIRERLQAGETAIALGALALSLLLAFRRERIPAPPASPGSPPLPDSAARGRPVPAAVRRLVRRADRWNRAAVRAAGCRSAPDAGPAGLVAAARRHLPGSRGRRCRAQPLAALTAGGRAIASLDPVTGRVAFHEADLARLHGLGRRGRGLLALAAAARHRRLRRAGRIARSTAFWPSNAGLSPPQLRLSRAGHRGLLRARRGGPARRRARPGQRRAAARARRTVSPPLPGESRVPRSRARHATAHPDIAAIEACKPAAQPVNRFLNCGRDPT